MMITPRLLGWIVILYGILYSGMGFKLFIALLWILSGKPWENYTPSSFDGTLSILYIVGGIGLIRRTAWGRWLVMAIAAGSLIVIVFPFGRFSNIGPLLPLFFWAGFRAIPTLCLLFATFSRKIFPSHPAPREVAGLSDSAAIDQQAVALQPSLSSKQRYTKTLSWGIIGVGAILPWAVGLTVRSYLKALGKHVEPLSYFLSGRSFFFSLIATAWFAIPSIILALLVRSSLDIDNTRRRPEYIGLLVGGFVGTIGMGIFASIQMFWEFDPRFILIFPPHTFAGTVIGSIAGTLIGTIFSLLRRSPG